MIIVYGFLALVVLFVGYRLVQWFLLVEQFKKEGRDIRKEMERLAGMRMERK